MEEIPTISSKTTQTSIELISEIMSICHKYPELIGTATQRLCDLMTIIDPVNPPILGNKLRAQKEIDDHLAALRKNNSPLRPTSVVYRDIAMFLSKKHEIPFDPKLIKKKTDLIQWFDDHWDLIHDQFFLLLDQHPDNK